VSTLLRSYGLLAARQVDASEGRGPVRRWLEAEPDRTAKEIFQRLQLERPGVFPDGQLRTLQRRVQEWRTAEARRLILVHPSLGTSGHDFASATG
jgi:hypothetical protein